MFPANIWIIFAVALVCCSVGFKNFVWFMSVGYGFAIAGIGIALLVMFLGSMNILEILMCALFIVYGIRLGGFLLYRELKNKNFRNRKDADKTNEKKIPVFVKAVMWIAMGFFYMFETSPVFYRLNNGVHGGIAEIIGVVIMAVAVLIESISDRQKSAAKAKRPNRFCDSGLFRIVRCPNYFGEILFWVGCFVSGIGAVKGTQWIIAVLGLILIIYVMLSGAKRLETRHEKNYGNDPEYRAYAKKTPLVFPLIPIYSLKDVGFIK